MKRNNKLTDFRKWVLLLALSGLAVSCTGRLKSNRDLKAPPKEDPSVMKPTQYNGSTVSINKDGIVKVKMKGLQILSRQSSSCGEDTQDLITCVNEKDLTLISTDIETDHLVQFSLKKEKRQVSKNSAGSSQENIEGQKQSEANKNKESQDITRLIVKAVQFDLSEDRRSGGETEYLIDDLIVETELNTVDLTKAIVNFVSCASSPSVAEDVATEMSAKGALELLVKGALRAENICDVQTQKEVSDERVDFSQNPAAQNRWVQNPEEVDRPVFINSSKTQKVIELKEAEAQRQATETSKIKNPELPSVKSLESEEVSKQAVEVIKEAEKEVNVQEKEELEGSVQDMNSYTDLEDEDSEVVILESDENQKENQAPETLSSEEENSESFFEAMVKKVKDWSFLKRLDIFN